MSDKIVKLPTDIPVNPPEMANHPYQLNPDAVFAEICGECRPLLTKRRIKDAKPAKEDYVIWSLLTGFGLLVMPSGQKTFILDILLPSGDVDRFALGQPHRMSQFDAMEFAVLHVREIYLNYP